MFNLSFLYLFMSGNVSPLETILCLLCVCNILCILFLNIFFSEILQQINSENLNLGFSWFWTNEYDFKVKLLFNVGVFLFLELINWNLSFTNDSIFIICSKDNADLMYWKLHQPSMQLKSRKFKQIHSHFLILNIIWVGKQQSYEQIEYFSTKCLLTVYRKRFFRTEVFIFGKLCHNLQRLNFGAVISIFSMKTFST